MTRRLAILLTLICANTAHTQLGRGGNDWGTTGGDAHRTSWVRTDPKISRESMSKPGFAFLWKTKLDPASLTVPVLLNGYIGYRGFRSLGFATSNADSIYGLDTDLARVEWTKHFSTSAPTCGAAASVARAATLPFPPNVTGSGPGRSNYARSAAGDVDQGAVTIPRPPATPPPAATPSTTPARPAPAPTVRQPIVVYALSSDGMLHTMYASNGDEAEPALKFMPRSASGRGLIVVNGKAYAASTRGCESVKDGVWSVDLASKETSHWDTSDAIAGNAGFAFGPDGMVYVATASGKVVSLDGKTLTLKDSYDAGGAFTSSPLMFSYQDKTVVAVTSKDGKIHLLDGAGLKPLAKLSATSGSALTTWQDADGTRWFLAPGASEVTAWKLVDTSGTLSLVSGWSRKVEAPQPGIVINGVMFVVSGGARATLYAMEAFTGRDLWNSGDTIGAAVRGGISGGGSQVYLGGADGTLYVFGFGIEH